MATQIDTLDFKLKTAVRDKEAYYILKGSVNQEAMAIICKPNIRVPKYMKQRLEELKGEIDISLITVGNLNTQISIMNRTSRQKFNK